MSSVTFSKALQWARLESLTGPWALCFTPWFRQFLVLMRLGPYSFSFPSPCSAPPSIAMDTNLLQWSLDCGAIPLVCPVGRDAQGCSVMLDPTEVTAAISRTLHPHKVMFLNNFGGLRSQEQKAQHLAPTLTLLLLSYFFIHLYFRYLFLNAFYLWCRC